MTEKRWWIVAATAATIMGLCDLFRHELGWSGGLYVALVVIEVIAIAVALLAAFLWARSVDRRRRRN
jgi:hypothetical protein